LLQADEKQPSVLEEIALLINSKPNGVEEVCPVKKPPVSQIVVSPFDPIPVAGAAAPAAPAVTAQVAAAAAPAAGAVPAEAPAPAAAAQVAAPPAGEVAAGGAPASEAAPVTPAGTVSAQPQ
jgi:hypothetical protein